MTEKQEGLYCGPCGKKHAGRCEKVKRWEYKMLEIIAGRSDQSGQAGRGELYNPTQQDSWIERFDDEFPSPDGHDFFGTERISRVKSFIASEIERARYEAEQAERKIWFEAEQETIKRAREEGYMQRTLQERDKLFPVGDKLEAEKIRQSERERIIGVVKKFDVLDGIHGDPVKNPLMRLNDFKSFLLEELKK